MRILPIILTFLFLLFEADPVLASEPLINGFMAHPSSGNKEWVEFYNPGNSDLSAYWIDDDTSFTSDSGSSTKKSLSSLNTGNSKYPYIELNSFLNNGGDYVVLFSSDGTVIDQYQYTSDPGADVTIGRTPDGGEWNILGSATKGDSNGQSIPTPSPTQQPTPEPSPPVTAVPTISSSTSKSKSTATPKTPTPTLNSSTPIPSASKIAVLPPESIVKPDYKIASVAAAITSATPSASAKVLSQKGFNLLPWVGGGLIVSGIGIFSYVYLRNKRS